MTVPFCGRDSEMAALSEQLDQARGGAGTVVLVEGDAGMGKSRLLDEAVAVARRRGFRIGIGVADPGDGMVELATLMAALFDGPDPILDRAELPDSRTVPEQRYWVLQDLQGLLERAARQTPLLICLDDLQWTDGGTAAALRSLPNHLATVPVAWILAFRPSPGSRQFKSALGYLEHNGAEKMVLSPLDEGAVRQLTASIVQAEPDTGLLKMAERAGGNPFFLVEMLSGLKEEQLVRIESGRAELAETRLPRRARETMRWRLDQMSELAHQVAAVATALGRRFPFDDLAAMLERPPSALLGPVEELLQAGLFLESDNMLTFRHDLILETVRASLPMSVSRALDRQAATVLIARGALPLEARAVLPEAQEAAGKSGDECSQFVLELAESGLNYADGRFAQTLELVERAQRSGRVAADQAGLSPQYWRIGQARRQIATQWLCDALTVVDRFDESLQVSTASIAAAQHERQAWALNIFESGRARQLLQMGQLTDAGAALGKLLPSDIAHQVVSVLNAAGVVALGRVAIHTGDRNLARQAGDIAQVMLGRDTPSVRRHAAWLLAMRAMADGDPLRARQCLCSLGEDERTSVLPLFPMDITDEVQLVRIALAADDNHLAEHAVGAVRRRSQLNPDVRSLEAVTAHATGLMNHSQKDLAEAVELYEKGPRPLALASALEDLGNIALDDGGTDRGVDAFSRALVLYSGAGASWDAGRVRRRLWSVGVRRRLVPARRPDNGWAALTDSELAVARLVAQGLSNREVAEHLFLSPHTVSGHLRHVFAKLGVNSRVDLARIAASHEAERAEP